MGSCIERFQKTLDQTEPWFEKYLLATATNHITEDIKAAEIFYNINARRRSSVRVPGIAVGNRTVPKQSTEVAAAGTKPIKGRVRQCRRRRVVLKGPMLDVVYIDESPLTKATYRKLCRQIKRSANKYSKAMLKDYFKFKV